MTLGETGPQSVAPTGSTPKANTDWTGVWRPWARALAALPLELRVVLMLAALLHAIPLSWGMPASDGWDVDGIAPRDVLPGVAATYTPGQFYTYPPLQLAIVAVLTLPVTVAAAIHAGGVAIARVLPVIVAPTYMTPIAMIARMATFIMSLGVILCIAKVAEEIAPPASKRRVALAAALIAAADAPFTYYSHVTNVDVPYLFWAWLAILRFARAIVHREPRKLRTASVFVALSVATKDQAYAMFVVSAPLLIGLWIACDRASTKRILREAAVGAAIAAAMVLAIDGAFTNPSGFRARLAFLSGSASRDFATYSADAAGRWSLIVDTGRAFQLHFAWVIAIPVLVGVAIAVVEVRARPSPRTVAALLPGLVALSFTVCFNLVARRVEERFTLPQALGLTVYAGLGLERLWAGFGSRRGSLYAGRALAIASVMSSLWRSVDVDATMLNEPRYDTERWIGDHAHSGDVIDVQGLNVYLARFSPNVRVLRAGLAPEEHRNPMYGVEEIVAPHSAIAERQTRFVVVNECYSTRFVERPMGRGQGRIASETQRRDRSDPDTAAFFERLFRGRMPYHLAHRSEIQSAIWPRFELHASLGCPMFVFERDAR